MFNIPDLDTRKQHTTYVIQTYNKFLDKITKNKNVKLNITFFFHSLFVIIPLFILIFSSIDIYFYISFILWILIVLLHFYFNSCIFVRIERELMEDKTWKGIWTYLFNTLEYFNINITKQFANFIFMTCGFLFTHSIFIKLLIHFKPSLVMEIMEKLNKSLSINLNPSWIEYILNTIIKIFFQKNILNLSSVENSQKQSNIVGYGILFVFMLTFIFFTPYVNNMFKKKMIKSCEVVVIPTAVAMK